MTERTFIENVITMIDNGATPEEMAEIRECAVERLEKLEAAAQKKKEKAEVKARENEPLYERIYNEILTDEPMTATTIAEHLTVSVQKATALMRHMVDIGRAAKTDVKIPKKGTQKGYTKV